MSKIFLWAALVSGLAFQVAVEATHGYWAPGYGTKSVGMGGVATAYAQDSLVAAVNPAGMWWVKSRFDVGAQLFSPRRRYSYTGFGGDHVKSGRNWFVIPHLGFNGMLWKKASLGFSMYGNGGLNTKYPRNNPAFGHGKLGVNYEILVVAPTFAYEALRKHAVGISPLLGLQKIKLYGLQNFAPFSTSPDHVSNKGYNYTPGLGGRIGYLGQFGPQFWFGAAYSSKIYMKRVSKYRGMLADHGRLDIPANWSVGVRFALMPNMNATFDFQRVYYHGVRPISNRLSSKLPQLKNLGAKNGSGFGWHNLSVYKVGMDMQFYPVVLRGGYSYNPDVYHSSEIDPNIIAPAVIRHRISFGATVSIDKHNEIDLAYYHSFKRSIVGTSKFGLGRVKETMFQNGFEINYGLKF